MGNTASIQKFRGKKLLMLGSNTLSCEAIRYAKQHGAYTIAADYLPVAQSPAKQIADEALMISTADTDALVEYCRRESIDGVFAGISEFNLIQAQKVSEALNLRYYFNKTQWDLIERKDCFKALCAEYGVKSPRQWFAGTVQDYANFETSSLRFPLIVKPVDGSASQGITICESISELEEAVRIAFLSSDSGRIIIEAFVRGHEFTAHYTICNGNAALACIDNRYPVALHEGSVTTIPIARIYPALFQDRFIEAVNPQLIALCEGIGLKNAILFVQGLYDDCNEDFYIFEAGLRSAAESPCRFLESVTGQNHYFMLVDDILLGHTDYRLELEKPDLNGKCCAVVSFASAGGVVADIQGLEAVQSTIPEILQVESRYSVGSTVPNGDTLRQIMLRFVVVADSRKRMAEIVKEIGSTVHAVDQQGKQMLIGMQPERVFSWN